MENWNKYLKEVENGILYPVYLLAGEEKHEKEYFEDRLYVAFSNSLDEGLEAERFLFYGDEVDFSDIENELYTFSFFNNKKFIVIRKAEGIFNYPGLLNYIKSPNTEFILVLETDKSEKDLGKELVNAVKKVGRVVMFWIELYQSTIERWLIHEFKTAGINLDIETARYIINQTGMEKEKLKNQINIISNYLGENKDLTLPLVKSILSSVVNYSIFKLMDAIFFKNSAEVVNIFRSMLEDGENIVKLNSFMWQYFKKLLIARSYYEKGLLNNNIKNLTNSKMERDRILKIVKKLSVKNLKIIISKIAKIDYTIKTNKKYIAEIQFERLLISISSIRV